MLKCPSGWMLQGHPLGAFVRHPERWNWTIDVANKRAGQPPSMTFLKVKMKSMNKLKTKTHVSNNIEYISNTL